MMQLADFEFVQLTQDTNILPFLSEDEDLNNFLTEDAKNYSADLMAVTYLFIDKEKQQTVAYFSLLNDKVAYDPRYKTIWDESIVVYTIVNVVAATLLQRLVVWQYPKNMLAMV